MNCENCKLNPSCTMVWRKSKKECPHFIQRTNGDSIRDMSDEELADWLSWNAIARCEDFCTIPWIDWLRQPAEGEQHG